MTQQDDTTQRVLKPAGILIFKWNAIQIRTPQILALTPHKPLFGHPSGKRADTHWMTFIKPAAQQSGQSAGR